MKHNQDMFYSATCRDIEFDDYLLLGGGTDINPNIYGEQDIGFCQSPNNRRDQANIASINKAIEEGKPIFGICRGLQLLDAVFDGKLIQHTRGQPSSVAVHTPNEKGEPLTFNNCSSCHHQMVDINHTKGQLLGFSTNPIRVYLTHDKTEERSTTPEILYWPKFKALAVQFHPEWHGPRHAMNVHLRGLIKELLGLTDVL